MSIHVVGGEDKQTVSYVFSSQAKMWIIKSNMILYTEH